MTKFNSLAQARVIGPEGGAWGGGASGDAKEGAAGVDVLMVSSSGPFMSVLLLHKTRCKWANLVQLMQKFVPRSRVRIFRNERTRSTPVDPKLMF